MYYQMWSLAMYKMGGGGRGGRAERGRQNGASFTYYILRKWQPMVQEKNSLAQSSKVVSYDIVWLELQLFYCLHFCTLHKRKNIQLVTCHTSQAIHYGKDHVDCLLQFTLGEEKWSQSAASAWMLISYSRATYLDVPISSVFSIYSHQC